MSKTTSSFFEQIETTFATVSKQLSQSPPDQIVKETRSTLLKELKTQRLPAAEACLKTAAELHNELSAKKSRRSLAKMPGSKHLRLPSKEFDKHFPDVPDQDILNARRQMLEKKQDLANVKALIQKFSQPSQPSQPSPPLQVEEPTSSGSKSGPTNGNGPR